MPPTMSGFRPTRSDQCPVAIWVTLHTARVEAGDEPDLPGLAPCAAR